MFMGLRALGWAAAGLVVGFVLGGMPARRELRALSDDYAILEQKLAGMERPNFFRALFPGFREPPPPSRGEWPAASNADDSGDGQGARERADELQDAPGKEGGVYVVGADERRADGDKAASGAGTDADSTASRRPFWARRGRGGDSADGEGSQERAGRGGGPRSVRAAMSAQRVRAAAARAALIADANLNDEQIARVDQAVTEMNTELTGYGEEMVATIASEEEPKPAEALSAAADTARIMYEAQEKVDAVVKEAAGQDTEAPPVWDLFAPTPELEAMVEEVAGEVGQQAPAPAAEPAPAAPATDAGA